MPAATSYPGVYIEEIPNGVRTITGVATSITAFVGRALRGPVNESTTITSYADFERRFGGLGVDYPLSYAVRDFYLNGGTIAIIVRLYKAPSTADGSAKITLTNLNLRAISPGEWGKNLYAVVDHEGIDQEVVDRYGMDTEQLFNLTVVEAIDGSIMRSETFLNLAFDKTGRAAGARRVDRVLEQESDLVSLGLNTDNTPDLPTTRPDQSEEVADGIPAVRTVAPNPFVTISGKKLKWTAATPHSGQASSPLKADDFLGHQADKTGFYALEKANLFNLLCIPPDTREGTDYHDQVYRAALPYCVTRRAILIVDPPKGMTVSNASKQLKTLGLSSTDARNAALYFPRVQQADPQRDGQTDNFVPCGIVAGVMARTDVQRGVWKAPAGLDAALNGVQGLEVNITDLENKLLSPLGINCLRSFPVHGHVVWGARTLRGADQLADEYKYLPIRRLALFLEESLYRGTQWVVFEPNAEPLWAQIRLNVGAFLHNLFLQGAFQGATPRDAYFVKCDGETTNQTDRNSGIVNVVVGFAPLKPAEFVILKLQQIAGQIDV